MELKIGEVYNGFKLEDIQQVKEMNSVANLFRHQQSGARLLYIANEDDNKVFSITFRTPVDNSTGVPHIMEHSTLCGSRKFPMKEPFVELVKGSLNTFLNAMTFADKTMYPVASRNDKDFRNLMDVYLDAVFYPNIYKQPEILMQEGWHYEIEDPADELSYKGVVYNEMKGVFSSPEAVLERKIQESLFPDTNYRAESGGDPEFIPELTQQQFLDFHRKYYHPANCYIYLFGDMDILDQLKFLDEAYLSDFTLSQVDSEIPLQRPFTSLPMQVVDYSISREESSADKTFLSLNYVIGESTNPETHLAAGILQHLLLGTAAAPLKKALIDAEVGKDVFGNFNESIRQPILTIGVRGANEDQIDKFREVVQTTLEKLVAEGIDKKLIEASVNKKEFELREADFGNYPKGLIYNIKCMDSWLYDASPVLHLAYDASLQAVKQALTTPYFEQMIKKYLLENTHCSLVIAKPQPGLAEQRSEQLKKKLAEFKAKLSPAEIEKLIAQTAKLKARQTTEDSPEVLATIPLLSLKDIEPQAEVLPLKETQEAGVKTLVHDVFTNHIAYVNLYFDTQVVPEPLIPYVYLLDSVLGRVNTDNYSYTDLSNEVNIHTGGITYKALAYEQTKAAASYTPRFVVKSKVLVDKLPRLNELLGEIIGHSQFNDTKRLKELIQAVKAKWERFILERGQQVAASRALSYFSPAAKYNELGILSFYQFIADIDRNFTAQAASVSENLAKVAQLIFNKANLMVSVTIDKQDYRQFQEHFPRLLAEFGEAQPQPVTYNFKLAVKNEGLMTSSKVQYVAKAANAVALGYKYHGGLKVLETIFRYDYLWNKIRVQGGAYGAFAQFERTGNVVFASYRDPNLAGTLDVYDRAGEYLHNFSVDEREMTKYIIGTISGLDTPLTPASKGERAAEYYLKGVTQADIQRERDEILATRQADIKGFAQLVTAAMEQNYICVLGNEAQIKANKDRFGELINVFA